MTRQPVRWQSQAPKEESEQVACGQSCPGGGGGSPARGSDSVGERLPGVQWEVGWGNHALTAVPAGCTQGRL